MSDVLCRVLQRALYYVSNVTLTIQRALFYGSKDMPIMQRALCYASNVMLGNGVAGSVPRVSAL